MPCNINHEDLLLHDDHLGHMDITYIIINVVVVDEHTYKTLTNQLWWHLLLDNAGEYFQFQSDSGC